MAKNKSSNRKSRKKKNKKGNFKKIAGILLCLVLLVGGYYAYKIWGPNTGSFVKDEYLYIKTGSTYNDVLNALKNGKFIKDINSFDLVARKANYHNKIKAGKYKISNHQSNYTIVKMLRSGKQESVKFTFNKLRTKNDFIQYANNKLEADELVLQRIFIDTTYLKQFGLDTNTAMCALIPDTYEFWWNTSAENLYKKLAKYYADFWTDSRRGKAIKLGLTPQQVITLSSIVEEETNQHTEKSKIASVYLNRLKKGMKLQADPTVKFALNDFAIKRITNNHLNVSSPYNTYQNLGLPPGPICTPSKISIDAVLNAETTNYLYFCAKSDFSGYHTFAATYDAHLKNAQEYWKALNQRGIK